MATKPDQVLASPHGRDGIKIVYNEMRRNPGAAGEAPMKEDSESVSHGHSGLRLSGGLL
jgi:hypothetical protein